MVVNIATLNLPVLQGHAWFIAAEIDVNGWICACCDHGVMFPSKCEVILSAYTYC